jgi:hypothetical protein
MARVVIVGEIYSAGGHPDQGLPEGGWGGERPDQGLPGRPEYPSQRPPRPERPTDPGYGWGGEYPSTGPVRPGRPIDPGFGIPDIRPDQGLPVGPEQLPTPPTPPGDLSGKVVVAVWVPTKGWAIKAYPIPPVHPDQGGPTPPVATPKG